MLATSITDSVVSGVLYTVLGGAGLLLLSALIRVIRKFFDGWRAVKQAPVLQDAADIVLLKEDVAELKTGFSEINGWLRGGKDLLGRDKHDGFIETFPKYQDEVRLAVGGLGKKIDDLVPLIQNGHSKSS